MGQQNSKRRQSYTVRPVARPKPKIAAPAAAAAGKIEEPKLQTVAESKEQSIVVPTWVNADNFHDILVDSLDNYEKILKFNARSALPAGENYATVMLRITIDVQLKDNSTKTLSFMLKVPHDTETMRQMLEIVNFFDSENEMYFNVLPELEEMYKAKGLDIKLGAKAFKFKKDTGSPSVLLQDLCPEGYKNANRLECLDMAHCKCVLRKMAQFHAVSATRICNRGPFNKKIMDGFGDPNNPAAKAIFEGMISSFKAGFTLNIKLFKDYELYEDLLLKRFACITDDFLGTLRPNDDSFAVLNHGDSWCNNILFKYAADGSIEDTIFVDYQMPMYGSPAQDLLYFIFSSTQLDIKLQKFDYMIRFYHEQLLEHLKLLGYSKRLPQLRELQHQLLDNCTWAITSAIVILPVVVLEPNDKANFDNFIGESSDAIELKNQFYRNPRFIEHINAILPWMLDRGYLEQIDKPEVAAVASTKPEANSITQLSATERTPVPAWLKEDYFEDILRSTVANFKQIRHFNVKPGTSAGDNYASSMLAIDIEAVLDDESSKELAYMLKISLNSAQADAMLSSLDVFDKETLMYAEILPAFEALYKRVGVDVQFGPQYYTFQRDPGCKTVLLENLRPHGYKNADRLAGLDINHTRAVLAKLAQLHAASAQWHQEHGSYPAILLKGMFNDDNRAFMDEMMKKFYRPYLDVAQTYDGSEEYIDKLKTFENCFVEMLAEIGRIDPNNFNVLNHGDCWTNNFMFQYDASGNIANTLFVDYQMVKYGGVAQDLYYFLCSSPELQIKVEQFDACISYYYNELCKYLKLLNYAGNVPSLRELHIQLLQQGGWAFSAISGVMAAVLLENTKDASMEMWLSEDDAGIKMKQTLYSGNIYRKHAIAQLKWCNHRGLLDYCKKTEQTLSMPAWVKAENFTALDEQNKIDKILQFSTESASKLGDNYASQIIRVNLEALMLDGSTKDIAYVLKVPTAEMVKGAIPFAWNFFPKEKAMYSQYIPGFERLFAEAGQAVRLAPRFLNIKQQLTKDAIIMEDLLKRDFKMANRFTGLDLTHTQCVLRKLAQFHAASVRYMELNGAYPECMNIGLYNQDTLNELKTMMNRSSTEFEDAVKQYAQCQEFAEKLLHAQEVCLERLLELGNVDPNEFNVLNHGDCWLNNIMFQYDATGAITETLFVDFQVSKYGSPAHDLYFFLMSSTQLDIKVEKFDYFIKYYHENLVQNLQLLKYAGNNVPTLKQLHETLLKYGFLGVAHSVGVTALALLEPEQGMTFDTFMADSEAGRKLRLKMYAGERITANANVVYPWLHKRGLLDIQ